MSNRNWFRLKIQALFGFPGNGTSAGRYRVLRRNITILMLLVTLVPLSVMAVINYYQYRKTLREETIKPLMTLANKTRHSFDLYFEERLSTVRFIASTYSFEELSDKKTLNRIFRVLKTEFGGFVDLGLIGQDGTQVTYAGPYNLLGKNYREQTWFHEVVLRGVYISDVFLGYRKFPHVAIAVQRLMENGHFWIVRATIDTGRLNSLVASKDLEPEIDAFLINRLGILQTPSKYYGDVLQQCPLSVPAKAFGINVLESLEPKGRKVLIAYSSLSHPDYTLIIVKPQSLVLKSWYTLKSKIVLIFLTSVTLIMIVIFRLTGYFVVRMKQSDEKREAAFRELEHSHKLSSIGRLAAGVAHEINNPMAIINEKAGLIKDLIENTSDFKDKEKILSLVNSILHSVDRCKTITHRLLGFARRLEVNIDVLSLNELLKEVLSFIEKEIQYRNVHLKLQFDPDLPKITSDWGQLEQVFLNILTNALTAVEDGGMITIITRGNDMETVMVSIRDNGCGMSEETLEHIFEPFFTKKKYGTGLGLPITYGIVKKLGGDIQVQSKEGEGTTFTVFLPKNFKHVRGN
ncbi:MAG: two-component sensor histidine kinase [Deltaproteobacteria bacterium]|nr:two-component sensor histidine kinase [Deltaproteobacteria bacterium]MBW2154185.1 two-component sensor histidine kinase [Deltaproteobacteria bacterium]